MSHIISRISTAGLSIVVAATSLVGLGAPVLAQSGAGTDASSYVASLHPLNHSGVTGFANLTLNSNQPGAALMASVNARGTDPNQIHAIHIHGKLDEAAAECPTIQADTNKDHFVSVFEGAPFYGPIKVSFTSPVTPFGPPSNTALFAPFAGSPTFTNFPHSTESGNVSYNQTIPFDSGNRYAVQALESLTPLEDQHIVIHGGFAPESVDTAGGDPHKIVYDALLPVACGSIRMTHQGSPAVLGSSISNTGTGSQNSITQTNNSNINNLTSNMIDINNHSSQGSTTGNVSASSNSRTGNIYSGNAANSSSSATTVSLLSSLLNLR